MLECRIDPRRHELRRGEETVKITPRSMQVLLALAEHAGEVLTRDQIFDRVWGDHIVGDEALTRCIADLRKAFQDRPSDPRYIRTIPKKGYCLLPTPEPVPETLPIWQFWERAGERSSGKLRWLIPAAALLLTLILLAAGYSRLDSPPQQPLATSQLTSSAGLEMDPALSPDGRWVVYAHRRGSDPAFQLILQDVDSRESRALTEGSAPDLGPTWGPEGRRIAFMRHTPEGCRIIIHHLESGSEQALGSCESSASSQLSWSATGQWLALAARESAEHPYGIFLINVESRQRKLLIQPDSEHWGDKMPVFSPDGSQLAFVRSQGLGAQDLFVIPVTGGSPRRLTLDAQYLGGHTWTPDGGSLIFSSLRGGHWGLWEKDLSGGPARWLPVSAHQPRSPQMARGVRRLVFEDSHENFDVVTLALNSKEQTPRKMIDSTRLEVLPQLSPDGSRMAFVSDRSGNQELWLQQGEEFRQLTHLAGTFTGPPRWSPDSRFLVFDNRSHTLSHIYRLEIAPGKLDRLSPEETSDLFPAYSLDGRFIYFGSNRTGRWQVWRMPAGGGQALQVTQNGGYGGQETAAGILYFNKFNQTGIWWMAREGGPERFVEQARNVTGRTHWLTTADGLYFLSFGQGSFQLGYLSDPQAGVEIRASFQSRGLGAGMSLAVDQQRLDLSQLQTQEQDLMLVDLRDSGHPGP